jgi:hypothetical protein
MVFSLIIMLLFNIRGRTGDTLERVPIPTPLTHLYERPTLLGWPFVFQKSFKKGEYVTWYTPQMMYDGVIAFGIAGVLTAFGEWILRRREAKDRQQNT